jgi:hypothetical protein
MYEAQPTGWVLFLLPKCAIQASAFFLPRVLKFSLPCADKELSNGARRRAESTVSIPRLSECSRG